MSYRIAQTSEFEKEAKYLAKKYASFKEDLAELATSLLENPRQGVSIGHNCYKIRVAIASKGKGKRGGARVITYIAVVNEIIFLVGVYDKSERATISEREISDRLKGLL